MTNEPVSDVPSESIERGLRRFDFVTITALEVFLMLAISIGTVTLFLLLWHAVRTNPFDSLERLQVGLRRSFSGVLMVMLGLELLVTLRTYFETHHVKVETILIVAIIAAGSHIIEIDVAHAAGVQLVAYGALMLALTASYFLVKKTHGT